MNRKLKLLSVLTLGAAAASVGGVLSTVTPPVGATAAVVDTSNVEWTYEINSVEDFKSVFNKGYDFNFETNIKLNCDIDLTDQSWPGGVEGEFNGVFDGGGHTITFSAPSSDSLFNIVRSTGTIQNVTIHAIADTPNGNNIRPLVYQNEGTIVNTKVVLDVYESINTVAIGGWIGSGTYENFTGHYIIHDGATNLVNFAPMMYGGSPNLINSFCTVNGADASNLFNINTGVGTISTQIGYARIEGPKTITSEAEYTVVMGGTFDDERDSFEWSVDGDSIAIVEESQSSDSVKVTSTGEGTSTLLVSYNDGDVVASLPVATESAQMVTAVEISVDELSLESGLTKEVTIKLTGNDFGHIEWISADPTKVGVSGDATGAEIEGLSVTDVPVAVTVNVYDGEGEVLATDFVNVTVLEPIGFNVTLLAPVAPSDGPSNNQDTVYLRSIANQVYTPVERVKYADKPVQINYSGTGYYVFNGFVPVTELQLANGVGLVYNQDNGGGQWGVPYYLDNYVEGKWLDVIIVAPGHGNENNVKIDGYEAINKAIDFVGNYFESSETWRVDGSICWLADGSHDEALSALLNGYDELAEDVRGWASSIYETVDGGDATFGDSIEVLRQKATKDGDSWHAVPQGSISFFGNSNNQNALVITVAFAVIALVGAVAGVVIYKHRRSRA